MHNINGRFISVYWIRWTPSSHIQWKWSFLQRTRWSRRRHLSPVSPKVNNYTFPAIVWLNHSQFITIYHHHRSEEHATVASDDLSVDEDPSRIARQIGLGSSFEHPEFRSFHDRLGFFNQFRTPRFLFNYITNTVYTTSVSTYSVSLTAVCMSTTGFQVCGASGKS